jgi:hypothetical protein
MRNIFLAAGAALFTLPMASLPAAAAVYEWTLTSSISAGGSGTLTIGDTPAEVAANPQDNRYDLTSFTGTIGGQTIHLFGGDPNADISDGAFIYDNRVAHLPGNVDIFDSDSGVLFQFDVSGNLGNIWSNGAGGTSYSYYVYTYGQGYTLADTQATFSVTDVPELSTWAMMGLGFASLGFAGYRRNKAATVLA